ncbi:MAG: aspartate carbamoyltransferase regulatory subunit [Planctomycetes bacterium]|nr:aspartate carbamoyltransferase regulatory subunit [Planctomycetota bacterium]
MGPGNAPKRAKEAAAVPGADSVKPPNAKMQVSAVRSGTVIDHLGPRTAFKALKILGIAADATVLIGVNLDSSKLGKKDILKIEGRELTEAEMNKVALLSPQATFSVIRDFKVVKKFSPTLPDTVEGLIRCVNPACITQDPRVTGRFLVAAKKPLKLRCYFCERSMRENEIEFL